jgi:CheY-like chemotaxis protein
MNRLLVIDDDPAWRALYRLAFEGPFELFEATDAQEALAMLGAVSPDVILLDLRMPRMGGLDFMRRLDRKGIRIPIVVCSGVVSDGEPLSVPGGVKVAPKASNLRELRAALREAAPQVAGQVSAGHVAALQEDTDWRD